MRTEEQKMERLKFIDTIVEFNRNHSNDEWGRQHVKFINSLFETANQDKKLFLETHGSK